MAAPTTLADGPRQVEPRRVGTRPRPDEAQRQVPPEVPPELPAPEGGCELDHDYLAAKPIDADVITPKPGSATLDELAPMPLIVAGADQDELLQRCRCNMHECEGSAVFDVVDPVAYSWRLTGPGSLRRVAGPSTIWDPPQGLRVPFDVTIEAAIEDRQDNDPDVVARFLLRFTPVGACGWERVVDVLWLRDAAGELVLGTGECSCRPHTAVWAPDPIPLAASASGPTYVCAGARYIIDGAGTDEDQLTLSCVGECGSDVGDVSVPDEVYYTWSARRGSFADHTSGPSTNGWTTTAIYQAPSTPGAETIEVTGRDSGAQARDKQVRKKLDLLVITTDLDIDSDNTRGYRPDGTQLDPERDPHEDDIEDDCHAGKVVRVNNADEDDDGVPDFADGYERFGEQGADASASFTPLIVHIPEPIDLDRATVQFVYSASDPASVTRTVGTEDTAYTPAVGHLRVWGKDGGAARGMLPLHRGGDFAAPAIPYRPSVDFPAPMAPRTWRFFVEGIDVSDLPGDQRIIVYVDPDGGGPAKPCHDAVRLTVIREAPVDAEAPPDPGPYFASDSRPWIELEPIAPGDITWIEPGRARVRLEGRVRDHFADIVDGGRADLHKIISGDDAELPVTRDPATPRTRERPFAFEGDFDGEMEVALQAGDNELRLRTDENVIGLVGEIAVVIRAEVDDPVQGTLRVTRVDLGEPAPVGCFRSYFDRVHDVRGNRGPLELDGERFALVPDRAEAHTWTTREPFAVLRRAPRISDPNLRVVAAGERLAWRYDTVQGTWPVTDVDIDADVDGDGHVDDRDDPDEALFGAVAIGVNGDDDDGDGRRDAEDDRVNGADDESELTKLVLRRPKGLADDAEATEVKLRKSGSGRVRVFTANGSEVLLGPDDVESRDLWPDLRAGDLEVKLEGVERGPAILELWLRGCGPSCTDAIALNVVGYVLRVGADEPFLDHDVADDHVLVPADHRAVDYRGAVTLGLNLYAVFFREDQLDSEELPEDCGGQSGGCTLRWEVRPAGGNVARQPKLRDLRDPCVTAQCWGRRIDAKVEGVTSRVQLDPSFDHPSQGDAWVKAGDRFTVTVSAMAPDGERLEEELVVEMVPGAKVFHVTEPPPGFDPARVWRLSDTEFERRFSEARFEPPVGSGMSDTIDVYLFDRFRNPLDEGADVAWRLEGSGSLGSLSPADPEPFPTEAIEGRLGPSGLASIRFTQSTFPSCPWDPDANLDPSHVLIASGSAFTSANTSVTKTTVGLPDRLGPVELKPLTVGATGITRYDIAARPRITLSARAVRRVGSREVPLVGVPVQFSSLNGKLEPADGVATTNSAGWAIVELTSEGAVPGEITVLASLGTVRTKTPDRDLEWYTTAPTVVSLDHEVISPDTLSGEVVHVEVLEDTGEALAFPGAAEGDGWLGVPAHASATVTVKGLPNHTYLVNATDELSWGTASLYPFDGITPTGDTPDVRGGRTAKVHGARVDPGEKARGQASLRFDGNDRVEIPSSPAVDLAGGLLAKLHVRPTRRLASTLLERPGQWRLELLADGRLRFSADGASVHVESDGPVPLRTWSFVDIRYDGASLRLGVGRVGEPIDSTYALLPAMPPSSARADVVVGAGFHGHLDEIELVKGGQAPALVDLDGIDPRGTVTTDSSGNASFTVRVPAGAWNPQRWQPVRVRVELSGSERAEAEVWVCPKQIWGDLVAMGKAFLTGSDSLGEDARWYHRAAAWVGEYMPLVSDLKTLFMEAYKGLTGCDSVSLMNVVFASVGLMADIATFGSCGAAIRGARVLVTGVAKLFMKELAKNVAIGEVSKFAVTAFMRSVTEQIAAADAAGRPLPAWIQRAEGFLTSMQRLSGEFEHVLSAAWRSVDDVFAWAVLHRDLGEDGVRALMRRVEAEGAAAEGTP